MRTVGVVGEGQRALEGLDRLGLLPQLLRLGLIELEHLGAGDVGRAAAGDHRGDEVGRRGAGAEEEAVADRLTVDRARERLAADVAGLPLEVRVVAGQGDRLEHRAGRVDGPVAEVVLEGGQRRARQLVDHVDVVGLQVQVHRLGILVDREGDPGVLRGAGAVVGLVGDQHELLVVGPGLELVRTVGERGLAVGLHVVEGAGRHRHVRGVAQARREVRLRGDQARGEGGLVDDLEAGEGRIGGDVLGGELLVALEGLEEVLADLGVGGVGAVVPGVDEVLRDDRGGAVGVGQPLPDLDGPVLVVLGLDRLRDVVLDAAVGLVVDQAREDHRDDAAAADLAGVGGQQGVLGLGGVRVDRLSGAAAGIAAAGSGAAVVSPAGGEGEGGRASGGGAQHHGSARDGHGFSWMARGRAPHHRCAVRHLVCTLRCQLHSICR